MMQFCRSRNDGRRCTRELGHRGLHRHRTIMWTDAGADDPRMPRVGPLAAPAATLLRAGFPADARCAGLPRASSRSTRMAGWSRTTRGVAAGRGGSRRACGVVQHVRMGRRRRRDGRGCAAGRLRSRHSSSRPHVSSPVDRADTLDACDHDWRAMLLRVPGCSTAALGVSAASSHGARARQASQPSCAAHRIALALAAGSLVGVDPVRRRGASITGRSHVLQALLSPMPESVLQPGTRSTLRRRARVFRCSSFAALELIVAIRRALG